MIDRLDNILDNILDNFLDNGVYFTTYFCAFFILKVRTSTMKGENLLTFSHRCGIIILEVSFLCHEITLTLLK